MSALYEFDKIEWRDVVRKVRPDITDEEYDRLWNKMMAKKAKRQVTGEPN